MLNVLDLFSGIGGFSLGLERTGGFKTVAFCEIEEFPRKVLAKHWPDVPIYHDIRELTGEKLRQDGIVANAIAAGFPCQDISYQGAIHTGRPGLDGDRSGLWSEVERLVREIRPEIVVVENVSALLDGWLGDILCQMAALGYDCQWDCIPASSVGAPHRRDRVWIVAHDPRQRKQGIGEIALSRQPAFSWVKNVRGAATWPKRSNLYKSELCRSRNGISQRLDAIGNAVVPQIPELIGRAILEAEGMTS